MSFKIQKREKDRLSFFSGGEFDEADLDSSSDEEEENVDKKEELSFITKSTLKNSEEKVKLPSAKDVLEKQQNPDFLKHCGKKDIDWDRVVKNEIDKEDEVVITNTHAIPPPQSYEPSTDNIKPTLGETDEQEAKKKRGLEQDEGIRLIGTWSKSPIWKAPFAKSPLAKGPYSLEIN